MKTYLSIVITMLLLWNNNVTPQAQEPLPPSYCNPLDIDYTYMVYNSANNISYRSGADPAVVEFRGEYYMFVTRSFGYWHSTDLLNWSFIKPAKWFFEGSNAPTAFNFNDSVIYLAGNPAGYGSILYTDNPKAGNWSPVASITNNIQDSELFIDDDGRTFLYWGSSNVFPIKVKELDKNDRMLEIGESIDLITLNEEEHGWERFGENNFHPTIKKGYMEGASITKYNDKYYLQYAAPGTQFNVYADGAYVGDSPIGPFTYMKGNPISFKPGGFANGAGHGMTLKASNNQHWHFATMALASNSHWERRLCMFPTYFDAEGVMHSNTHYGDYPRFAASHPTNAGEHNGWMLLSYRGKATVSSSVLQIEKSTADDGEFEINKIEKQSDMNGHILSNVLCDENSKSYWVAEANNDKQWVEIEMKNTGDIYAIQLNFHDHESGIYTRTEGLRHRFTIEASIDGINWTTIIDKSNSYKDSPNAYLPLMVPQKAKYIRYNNIEVPGKNLAMSEIRVFGLGHGKKPLKVKNFEVERQSDRRNIAFTWQEIKGAQGYNIRWGIAPDKLYHSWLVYDKTEHLMRSLDRDTKYYFSIEAFNENGISERTLPVFIE